MERLLFILIGHLIELNIDKLFLVIILRVVLLEVEQVIRSLLFNVTFLVGQRTKVLFLFGWRIEILVFEVLFLSLVAPADEVLPATGFTLPVVAIEVVVVFLVVAHRRSTPA